MEISMNSYMEMIPPAVKNNNELAEDVSGVPADSENPLEDQWLDSDEFIIIGEEGEIDIEPTQEFYDNLIETVSTDELTEIAQDLIDKVRTDKEDRSDKDQRQAKTMQRLGYTGDDVLGGASFQGASKVTHPFLTEMLVDFSSRAIKETMPPNGCVKTKIVGTPDGKTIQEAEKKKDFLNYLLTEKMGYRDQLEKLYSQLPLGGSQYMKLWWDSEFNEAKCVFVPIDQVYLPYHATDFYSVERLTHIQRITVREYDERIYNGVYSEYHVNEIKIGRDDDETRSYTDPSNKTKSEAIAEKIDGLTLSKSDDDSNIRELYEIYTYLKIDDDRADGRSAPYVITVDLDTSAVLSIYRNWERTDDRRKGLIWFVEFKYLPFRGIYGIGLPEIMDGAAATINGCARALVDAGHGSNFPPIVKNKQAKMSGQNSNMMPGTVTDLDLGSSADDVRKVIQSFPIASPSPVLLQLMQYFDGKGQSFQANINGITDSLQNGDAPVGTALALIEENSKRYAAIHARLHNSQGVMLKVLCRILAQNLDAEVSVPDLGDMIVTRDLFTKTMDIIPVSDPNIFSEAQRFAQVQSVMQMASTAPNLYNMAELHKRALQLINLPDYDKVLAIPQASGKLNPVAENISGLAGTPVQAFPEQDHMAHIQAHIEFLESPIFGQNPIFAPKLMGLAQHAMEHVGLLYASAFNDALMNDGGREVELMSNEGESKIDVELADMNAPILQSVQEMLAPYIERFQKVLENLQKFQPKDEDPEKMKIELEKQKLEQNAQKMQMEHEVDMAKIAEDREYDQSMVGVQQIKAEAQLKVESMKEIRGMHSDANNAKMQQHEMKIKEGKLHLDAKKLSQDSQHKLLDTHVKIATSKSKNSSNSAK